MRRASGLRTPRGADENRVSGLAALVATLLVLPAAGPARAHELGVTTAEMTEQADGRYVLVVKAPPALAHLFGPPEIPGRCRFAEPSSATGGRVLRFEWRCDEALTASDTLRFDWKREGIVLNVRWKDGTEVSGFFRRGPNGLEIPLSEIRAGSGSFADAARRYTVVGIEHILMHLGHGSPPK